jgi:hypothetical protein
MTEPEWLACSDPEPMLEFLHGRATDRKLRLFACACFRCTWPLLDDDWKRMVNTHWWSRMRWSKIDIQLAKTEADLVLKGVELAEQYADGLTDLAELQALFALPEYELWGRGSANELTFAEDCFTGADATRIAKACAYRARYLAKYRSPSSYRFLARFRSPSQRDHDREQAAQCHRLRDIFGNPFRPVTVDSTWLTSSVLKLAQAIYDDRAFDRLPRLADALVAAGCTNEDILSHCRSGGEHVRGCWVVDLMLGKE